jgi:hypothetical protein
MTPMRFAMCRTVGGSTSRIEVTPPDGRKALSLAWEIP